MNNLFLSTLQYSAQMRTRALIEQVNGQLKNKFRCLIGHGLQIRPSRAYKIITACCTLYNISKDLGDRFEDEGEGQDVGKGVNFIYYRDSSCIVVDLGHFV